MDPKQEADRSTASERIFSCIVAENQTQPQLNTLLGFQNLTVLRLRGLNLQKAAAQGFGSHAFLNLEQLSLQNCEDESSLLRLMTVTDHQGGAKLRRLEIIRGANVAWNPVRSRADQAHVLDSFLSSFSTLESLVIHAPNVGFLRPDLGTVANHCNQLTTHNAVPRLRHGPGGVRHYSVREQRHLQTFDQVCGAEAIGVELSVRLPQRRIGHL